MKLINVDDIKWQKGVFVNPITDEPLPIIHKVATIEMLRDWQEEVKAIPLDKIKQAKNEICKINPVATTIGDKIPVMKSCDDIKLEVVAILNKLIEECEG